MSPFVPDARAKNAIILPMRIKDGVFSPGGAFVISQGCQPLETGTPLFLAPEGRQRICRPSGAG